MANVNEMINWMRQRLGVVRYSMTNRLGPSSYDCSSAVYNALIAGGFLKAGSMGNTETLFNDLENSGWEQVKPINGNYPAKKGDIFIWGKRGFTLGAAGHTGIFIDDNDKIIHCNFGFDGISINDHDYIWMYNGQPEITIYRYTGKSNGGTNPKPSTPKPIVPVPQDPNKRIQMSGTFYPDRKLAVSADTNPDDVKSPALDYYTKGTAIRYDSYVMSNEYAWISYIGASGKRRYVAVGPDDGRIDTTWGTGFFN
ncbi:peptidoglycan amidohydrolase family protein [Enterococcus sp. UD-01]|uniref:peptidoglycan amidohydrolase family protein n=1 Tax=Enterococcus sp. UD-01 TaxID=3373911 RepID=UPI0038374CCF